MSPSTTIPGTRRLLTALTCLALAACAPCSAKGTASAPAGVAASVPPVKGGPTLQEKIGLQLIRSAFDDAVKVDDKYRTQFAGLLAGPDAGLVRILQRGRFEGLTEPRGGGAYYSFKTRSHSYNDEPDLELQQGNLSTGFYGRSTGAVVNIGKCGLESLDGTRAERPATMAASEDEVWKVLTMDAKTSAHDHSREFDSAVNSLRLDRGVKAIVGDTYLVRAVLDGEHDHLVAVTVLDEDLDGVTLVWRILKSWRVTSR